MLEPVIVVEAKAIVELGKYRKTWVVGWIVALLALVGTGVQSARLYEANRQANKVQTLAAQVRQVQVEQEAVTASYIKAWENQQATTNLLVTWGNYVKDRTEIAQRAMAGRPLNLYAKKQ